MGSTGIADGNDPWNLIRNPAVIGAIEGIYFSGSSNGAFFEENADIGWLAGAGWNLKGNRNVIRFSAAVHGINLYQGHSCPDDRYTGFTGAVELEAGNGLIAGFGVTARNLEDVCCEYSWSTIPAQNTASGWAWDYGVRIGYLHHNSDGGRTIAIFGGSLNRRLEMNRFCNPELASYYSDASPWEYRLGITLLYEGRSIHTINKRLGFEAPLVTIMTNIEEDFIEGCGGSLFSFATELSLLKLLYLRTGVVSGLSRSDVTFGAGVGISSKRVDFRIDMATYTNDRYDRNSAMLSVFLKIGFKS